jgi:hypothetical protein
MATFHGRASALFAAVKASHPPRTEIDTLCDAIMASFENQLECKYKFNARVLSSANMQCTYTIPVSYYSRDQELPSELHSRLAERLGLTTPFAKDLTNAENVAHQMLKELVEPVKTFLVPHLQLS